MALVDRYAGVIFDYGGVLAFHQTKEDAEHLAEIAGMSIGTFEQAYWADRGLYDKGLMTAEDYWDEIARKGSHQFTPDQIKNLIATDFESWIHFDSAMYDFVAELAAKGKRVAVLSNMPHELGEGIKATTRGFSGFQHVTLSYEVRSVKPEPEIYRHCLEGIGTDPAETLFLDDRPENIKGAEKLGIQGIQFTSRDEVLPRLVG